MRFQAIALAAATVALTPFFHPCQPVLADPPPVVDVGDGELVAVRGTIVDADTLEPIPARVHIRSEQGKWHLAESVGGQAVHYDRQRPNRPSHEVHTTLSPHPFLAQLPAGRYRLRVERGKEYIPSVKTVLVSAEPVQVRFELKRWINMAQRRWYSGDTHVHRELDELPNAMLAEDLNVALPLTYWVREADEVPSGTKARIKPELMVVDPEHVIYPINTEYEIFRVGDRAHTLGAVFVLNHRSALPVGAPPVRPIARLARAQNALLDLDKHNWPWSMMIVPVMNVDLFELTNNHLWQTEFGFPQWYAELAPDFMNVERNDAGLTELGWTNFGFQTYYALLNCGFRLRVSAGTASGVHPVQIGFGRVYVHLPEGFHYQSWLRGLDAGHSFVSTGPMLLATFNGRPPGATFQSESTRPHRLSVEASAHSRRPLSRLELVVNGDVQEAVKPQNERTSSGAYVSRFSYELQRDSSYWVAVRCFEDHPAQRVRFAHTNPSFVDVAERPVRPKKVQVDYFIQRMEAELERNRPVLTASALAEYREALAIYKAIAANAE